MRFIIRILVAICCLIILVFLTCQPQPRSGWSYITKSEVIAFNELNGAKRLPNGWWEEGNVNVKYVGSENDYRIYTDHNKKEHADMSVHLYSKLNFRWGYWPRRYSHADYEIEFNGKWMPVNMVWSMPRNWHVPGFKFVNSRWQSAVPRQERN